MKADIRRYVHTEEVTSTFQFIHMALFTESLWFVVSYRFGRWVRGSFRVPLITPLLKIISKIIHKIISLITGIQIPFETQIGPGLYIGHSGMLIINSTTVIGANCNLSPGVVIGQGGRGEHKGSPVLGDFVYIGVGAKLLGKISVGSHAAVGANAVVTRDVPPHATVAGIPARVVNMNGSDGLII